MRAEVGDFDPGLNEEPQVVDHEGEVLLTQLRRLADEAVVRGELPRGDGEAKHGEEPAVARLLQQGGLHRVERCAL